jgi:hypothetical protein
VSSLVTSSLSLSLFFTPTPKGFFPSCLVAPHHAHHPIVFVGRPAGQNDITCQLCI